MENEHKLSSSVMQRMRGRAHMTVCHRDGATNLEQLFQEGAAKLRFPDNDEANFEAVMINSAGGITGGDHLQWDITLRQQTQAILTSQAAEKVYKAVDHTPAKIDVRLSVAENARLCWLPQETIVFNHSALQRSLKVDLADKAELLLCETVVFGRKIMGETVERACLRDNWIVRQKDHIIHAEALRLGPDMAADLAMPVFLNGGGAMASLLLVAPDCEQYLEQARTIIGDAGGISAWRGKLLARIICRDSYSLRKHLIALINLLNNKAGVPKIWSI